MPLVPPVPVSMKFYSHTLPILLRRDFLYQTNGIWQCWWHCNEIRFTHFTMNNKNENFLLAGQALYFSCLSDKIVKQQNYFIKRAGFVFMSNGVCGLCNEIF